MYDDLPLVDNQPAHNFEMIVDGQRAFIDYIKRDNVYLLVHTEVPKELEGKGFKRPEDVTYFEMFGGSHDMATWGKAMPKFLIWAFGR